jgi:hypothetical protein
MRLNDAHLHFASHNRLGELESYLRAARVERLAAVSLPDPERISFNPEVLYAKLSLAPRCYGELARRADETREFLLRFRGRVPFGSDGFWFDPDDEAFAHSSLQDNLQRVQYLAGFLAGEREMDNPFPYTREEQPRLRGLGLGRSPEGRRALRCILRDNFRRLLPGRPAQADPTDCALNTGEVRERAERLNRELTGRVAQDAGGRTAVAGRRVRELVQLAARFRARPAAGDAACSGAAASPGTRP